MSAPKPFACNVNAMTAAERDATWLRLTGPVGVKLFIVEEFGLEQKIPSIAGVLP